MVLGGKLPGRVDGRRNPIFNYEVWRSLASAPDLGSGGRRFESCHPEFYNMVGMAQLVSAPDCGSGGRGFESHYPPFFMGH